MSDTELADVDSASATYADGTLTIKAEGTVPENCWRVEISESPIEIFPPQYEAVRHRTAEICRPVITDYSASGSFEIAEPDEPVTLHHAGGSTKVEVETEGGYGAA
jgi:hypothetical protein